MAVLLSAINPAILRRVSAVILLGFVVFMSKIGDRMVSKHQQSKSLHVAAFLDNFLHGSIAAISWMTVLCLDSSTQNIFTLSSASQVIIAALVGCCIDLDHFLAAKSLRLQDALNLPSRPIFHNTLLILVSACFFFSVTRYRFEARRYAWIFLASALQHHARDATRRGFLLSPIGSTTPLPQTLYLIFTVSIPVTVSCILSSGSTSAEIGLHRSALQV